MKIATWNVNSLNVRLPHVLDWLTTHKPDALLLQELKLDQDKFPLQEIENIGFNAAWYGQKTYNGVAIISPHPLENVVTGLPNFEDAQKRVITATVQGVRLVNVYCVNGESLESDKFLYKERWFSALHSYLKQVLSEHARVALLGDFNIAPHDIDVYDPEKWRGKILCSDQERAWFQSLLDLGLTDSLHYLQPDVANYTWWDYRMNMFRRKLGLRIDHILINQLLMPHLKHVEVDTATRALKRPSDHAPVWMQLDW